MHTFWDGQRFLMWDTRQIYELRCAYRLVGSTVGALPCNKRQICEYGVPLSLIAEEVILAAENGFMWVIDSSSVLPADPDIIDPPAGEEASRPPDTGWIGMDAIGCYEGVCTRMAYSSYAFPGEFAKHGGSTRAAPGLHSPSQ